MLVGVASVIRELSSALRNESAPSANRLSPDGGHVREEGYERVEDACPGSPESLLSAVRRFGIVWGGMNLPGSQVCAAPKECCCYIGRRRILATAPNAERQRTTLTPNDGGRVAEVKR